MRLMCDRRLNFGALTQELGLEFTQAYASEIESLSDLVADGLLSYRDDGIDVTAAGSPLLRVIAMRFDPLFVAGPQQHAAAI